MNIFLTSPDAVCSAQALDDKRVIKMTLETAQLLATACYAHDKPLRYKSTHFNHPCSIWARRNQMNFSWLVEHGFALLDEYSYRFYKDHASADIIHEAYTLRHILPKASSLDFTFNSSGYNTGDVFVDYQRCLLNKWHNLDTLPCRWSRRGRPQWYQNKGEFNGVT